MTKKSAKYFYTNYILSHTIQTTIIRNFVEFVLETSLYTYDHFFGLNMFELPVVNLQSANASVIRIGRTLRLTFI